MNVNVNGETENNDPLTVNGNRATPLHRAAFAGATATMSLLLQEPTCDVMARDKSFGDLKTPLHKAAAGGRYLAIQLLVQELRERNLLPVALAATDATNRTPLQVAKDYRYCSRHEEERESVARWDEVAGGPADWHKCVALLQAADFDLAKGSSSSVHGTFLKGDLPLPPLHLSTNVL